MRGRIGSNVATQFNSLQRVAQSETEAAESVIAALDQIEVIHGNKIPRLHVLHDDASA